MGVVGKMITGKQPCHSTCEKCGAECVMGTREHFAAMALQGMLANSDANGHLAEFAKRAVIAADFLIAALNKPTSSNSKE